MPQPPYDPKLTENMQTAAELILLKAKADWAPWVVFLLAEMEDSAEPEDYVELLQALQASIAGRLEDGSW